MTNALASGYAAIAILCVAVSGCVQSGPREELVLGIPERPNVIIILADDIGFGDIGANGNTMFQTPNLDALADRGANFLDFSVPSPVCSPSRAGLLTGQYPDRHGVFQHFASAEHHARQGMPDWLAPDAPSYARQLRQVGYATGHFGKWHLTNSHIPNAPLPHAYGFDVSAVFNGPGPQTDAVEVFDEAVEFIRDHADQPFLMNLWIHETHTPHYPNPDLVARYSGMDEQTRVYAATVTSADLGVGKIMSAVEELGLEGETLIMFFSDNGPEHTGDEGTRYLRTDPDAAVEGREPLGRYFSVGETAGLRGRKRDLYEGGVRVPFIMSWPGVIEAGIVDDETTLSAIDVFATVLELAGASPPNDYNSDGQSFATLLSGEVFERNSPLYWQRLNPADPAHTERTFATAAIRSGDWKLHLQGDGSVELYDLSTDRAETNNLAATHPEIAAQMKSDLARWQSGVMPPQADQAASASLD